MRVSLLPPPDFRPVAVSGVQVELSRSSAGFIQLRYSLTGGIPDLAIPRPAPPERIDGLWNHTCFEIFLAGEGPNYHEFNFSPSGKWAAWRFEGYRCGMVPLATEPPGIETAGTDERFELTARIALPVRAQRIALSAVIEEADGRKSFWALAHPDGPPDFHDPTCFAAELPSPAET